MNTTHKTIRPTAVAGSFYPDDANKLKAMIGQYMAEAKQANTIPKAIVAPHAGYVYSGPIAANAYLSIKLIKDKIKRVVLLGPNHRVYVKGMALSSADYFASPLGPVRIDKTLHEKALAFDSVIEFDEAHAKEHSLEVHLPFLQTILNDFTLLPILVGAVDRQEVGRLIDNLWNEEDTLIVVSSDLSHFHDYDTAVRVDQATTEAIESYKMEHIGPKQACGCSPLNGLLSYAKSKSLEVKTLDVRNSGDTAGEKDRVVGYGAYIIS